MTYTLTEQVREILSAERVILILRANRPTSPVGNGFKNGFRNGFSSSSSSFRSNITTTTNNTEPISNLEWDKIDLTPVAGIGLTKAHVRQIAHLGTLHPSELQESIYAYAFDLEVNGKGKGITGNPVAFFMGILRKGPYAPPGNYEPPEIRQRRIYLEAKEREHKARIEMDNRLEAIAFTEWIEGLDSATKARLIAPTDFAQVGSSAHNAQLKQHFHEKEWPERRHKNP
jgi:hypothetical protein